ncbi:hypothetical protein K3495_g633 [Podosphaera aphanis]|nr:hypothetical protein K3495_g633 [Podosphaera aphanis]
MADAISIEETNRIRLSLGMKPLPVSGTTGPVFKKASSPTSKDDVGSTLESRQAEGYENYRKLMGAEDARKKREEKSEAIRKARDAAKRFSKLDGKGLADGDDDDMNVKDWLTRQKKRQKQIAKARKLEKELAEAEMAAEYTSKDLAGVKVGHELDSFEEGQEQVLTLKDTTIDVNEEEGDELENLDLRSKERLNEKLELKKKKPTYNPVEIEETGEKNILAHYDEEILGKKSKIFTLDNKGSAVRVSPDQDQLPKKKVISLDILKNEPESDYQITMGKLVKPKKKKPKSTRRKAQEEEIVPLSTEIPEISMTEAGENKDQLISKKRTFEDISFVDDDDLQNSLAAQRRNALRKRQKLRPEQRVKQILEEASFSSIEADTSEGQGGLVIDETSEFVTNLQRPNGVQRSRRSISRQAEPTETMGDESDQDEDVNMEQSYANVEDDEDRQARRLREESINAEITNNGLEAEATLDRGLGSTLKLLKERGLIKTEETGDLNAIYRQKQLFLAEKQRREADAELKARAQRERDRTNGRLDRMTAREKEEYARSQNTLRDQIESRQLAEHFNKEYKPNVELKYIDEFGRSMNKKEAFKHLSHQFHGKGSGKQKTEKMLKKIEDEKRREAQSSLDSSLLGGMSGATAQQRKKQGQAGVRLA